jgi:hypothetical protein
MHVAGVHKCKDCGTMFGAEHKHLPNANDIEDVVEPIEENYDNPRKVRRTGQTMSEEEALRKV